MYVVRVMRKKVGILHCLCGYHEKRRGCGWLRLGQTYSDGVITPRAGHLVALCP